MLKFNPKKPANSVKPCKTCKHFINSGPFSNITYGRCKLFGEIDTIDGTIIYNYASLVRKYEETCGEKALLHTDNTQTTTE